MRRRSSAIRHPGARYNLALTRLRLGDWERGWAGYEARWRFREVHRRPRILRSHDGSGEELDGQRILLHAEQGLGDTIQFCRYASWWRRGAASRFCRCRQPVERLMQIAGGSARGSGGDGGCWAQSRRQFDLECPLMSLPAVFGTTVETVPWPGAYLGADPERRESKAAAVSVGDWRRIAGRASRGRAIRATRPTALRSMRAGNAAAAAAPAWRCAGFRCKRAARRSSWPACPSDVFVWDGSSRRPRSGRDGGADGHARSGDHHRHLHRASGRSDGQTGLDSAAPPGGLALDAADGTTPWYPTARLFRQKRAGRLGGMVERVLRNWRRSSDGGFAEDCRQGMTSSCTEASHQLTATLDGKTTSHRLASDFLDNIYSI